MNGDDTVEVKKKGGSILNKMKEGRHLVLETGSGTYVVKTYTDWGLSREVVKLVETGEMDLDDIRRFHPYNVYFTRKKLEKIRGDGSDESRARFADQLEAMSGISQLLRKGIDPQRLISIVGLLNFEDEEPYNESTHSTLPGYH